MAKSWKCRLGWHDWRYTAAEYRSAQMELLAIPDAPATRTCACCDKKQVEDRNCLGLHPPEYYSRWETVN